MKCCLFSIFSLVRVDLEIWLATADGVFQYSVIMQLPCIAKYALLRIIVKLCISRTTPVCPYKLCCFCCFRLRMLPSLYMFLVDDAFNLPLFLSQIITSFFLSKSNIGDVCFFSFLFHNLYHECHPSRSNFPVMQTGQVLPFSNLVCKSPQYVTFFSFGHNAQLNKKNYYKQ